MLLEPELEENLILFNKITLLICFVLVQLSK